MDLTKTDNVSNTFVGMSELPVVRQVGLLIGLAASIAVGIGIVLWSQEPDYSVLFSNISAKDSNDVVQVLKRMGVKYEIDLASGSILVENDKVQQARIELAAEGYPKGSGVGFELLQKDESIGTSTFLQNARYHRAKEEELARTINTIAAVKNTRVHLALPKDTVFIRDQKKARASVMLELASGYKLPKRHIVAITHLVASSISDLSVDDVTIVDSSGNLLTDNGEQDEFTIAESQFAYTTRLEQHYIKRIESILAPIVGDNKVRAQVVADIDFTHSESTSELFTPDPSAVRSEQRFEEQSVGSNANAGIPGALSNEPPAAGTAPEQATANQTNTTSTQPPSKNQRKSTLNYELDRTINHTKKSPTTLRKLSVAVVVDDKVSVNKKGETVRTQYTPEELNKLTTLVREAIGFNALRGDTVNVVNSGFIEKESPEALPEIPVWEQSWFWSVVKQALAGFAVLFLIFGVLKPTFRSLASYKPAADVEEDVAEDQLTLSGADGAALLEELPVYENDLVAAKSLAAEEPKRVAQVVKDWISDE